MTAKFPFAFDMNAMTEAFKMPAFDFGAAQVAHEKNVAALVEANKAAMAGMKAIYTKQTQLFTAALAEMKDRMADVQAQPMTADSAAKNMETAKAAFEKALVEVQEMTEMAQTANAEAFEIIKARAEEAMAEFKTAADKLAA